MNTMTIHLNSNKKGFTLIELLISLALGLMVMAAIYEVYIIQQKSYTNQQAVAEMEQNLRASMFLLKREIQKAGFNPNKETDPMGFIEATRDPPALAFTFASDVDGDKTIASGEKEGLRFSHYTDGDGTKKIGREPLDASGSPTSSKQPVAENIEALDFVFFGLDSSNNPVVLDDDGNGNVTTGIAGIRVVEITIIARASRPDINFTDTTVYQNSQGNTIFTPPSNDHYRRRVLRTSVECRNMGL
jgi:type IV pilus assembly protein PilW